MNEDKRPIGEIEAERTLEEIFSNATNESDGWFDKPLISWIRRINEAGVETSQSCSGHTKEENRGYLSEGHLTFFIPKYFDIPNLVYNLIGWPNIYMVRREYYPFNGMMINFNGKNESLEAMAKSMDIIERAIKRAI